MSGKLDIISNIKQILNLSALFFLCAWTLAFSLLIGGGAANLYLTNSIVQFAALPCLAAGLWRLQTSSAPRGARSALYLLGMAVVIVILQLVPLPPEVWSSLPLREKAVSAYAALGEKKPWAPLSLTPEATIVGALTIIPAAAVFLATVWLTLKERRLLTLVALAFGLVNALVGLMQLSQGPESHLYLFGRASQGEALGLFANRNHLAAMLYGLLPFAAAWIGGLTPAISIRNSQGEVEFKGAVELAAAGFMVFILIVATLLARSRAGVILLIVALVSGMSLQSWRKLARQGSRVRGVYITVAILAVLVGLQFGLYRILQRFEEDPVGDARLGIARITAGAAMRAWPYGTGLGSFAPLYASLQTPADLLPGLFVNLAHNEPLQFLLEAGAPGALLTLGFIVWLFWRGREVWRGDTSAPPNKEADTVDVLLPRAATLSIALLLMHSLVDFPLRTTALMTFFAFCCGLLVHPGEPAMQRDRSLSNLVARRPSSA